MKATRMLHEIGQSLWLDNTARELIENSTLDQKGTYAYGSTLSGSSQASSN